MMAAFVGAFARGGGGRLVSPWRPWSAHAVGAPSSSFVTTRPLVVGRPAVRRAAVVAPAVLGAVTGPRAVAMAVASEADAQPEVPRLLKGVHKPVAVTGALKDFAGVSISTRPELIRAISSYVKDANLQLETDKRSFRTDAKLRKILKVEECAFLSISKYLSPHLKKPEEVNAKLAKEAEEMVAAAAAAVKEMEEATGVSAKDSAGKKKKRAKKNSNKALGPARAKAEGRGIFKPQQLSKALSKVCGADTLSRPETVKAMWRYIKLNNLQAPEDRRIINCDALLKELFEVDQTDAFSMNQLLSRHLTKIS